MRIVLVLTIGLGLHPLGVVAAADCPAHSTLPLNLAWTTLDPNGLPLNPWWSNQGGAGSAALPDPADACMCGGFPTNKPGGVPFGAPRCTDQTREDVPSGFHRFICGLEWFVDGRRNVTRGHINWFPVTVTGYLSFASKSGPDDDYNFELFPDTRAPSGGAPGLTAWNHAPPSYHVEIKGAEAFPQLTQGWWVQFRQSVTSDQEVARAMLKDRPAAVIGLFGLDAEHKGHSELHPAHVIAVQTRCDAQPVGGYYRQEWALLVRNSGNEGFCSTWKDQHMLDVTDGITMVPLPLGSPAREALISAQDLRGSAPGLRGPDLSRDPAGNVRVAFRWASDTPSYPDRALRIHGTVGIKWKPLRQGDPVCRRPPVGATAALAGPDDELEGFLESVWSSPAAGTRAVAAPQATDSHSLTPAAIPAGAHLPVGACPSGAAQCPAELRARLKDRVIPAPLAAALDEEDAQIRRALCAGASERLGDLRRRAEEPGASARARRDLDRANALISYCNAPEPAVGAP